MVPTEEPDDGARRAISCDVCPAGELRSIVHGRQARGWRPSGGLLGLAAPGERPVLRFPAVTKSTGDQWLGVPTLAEELGVTLRTLYRLLDSGQLPSYRIGRVIRIRRVDVEAFRGRTAGNCGEPRRACSPVEHPEANAEMLSAQRGAAGNEWVMAPEAARLLGVQLHTIYHMIDRGELSAEVTHPADRPRPRRRFRIRRQEVADCIERARVKPGELRHLHP